LLAARSALDHSFLIIADRSSSVLFFIRWLDAGDFVSILTGQVFWQKSGKNSFIF
jgi:hypothetical protein